MHAIAAIVFLAVSIGPTGQPVTIYVGPQVREGFIDVDRGVLDSVNDIKGRLRGNGAFRVVETAEAATLKLFVIRRRTGTGGTGIGIHVAPTLSVYSPGTSRIVDTLLRVGDHERAFTADSGDRESWGYCAKLLVRDLSTWLEANRSSVER